MLNSLTTGVQKTYPIIILFFCTTFFSKCFTFCHFVEIFKTHLLLYCVLIHTFF